MTLPILLAIASLHGFDEPFPKEMQTAAIAATVLVINRETKSDGCAVVVGKKDDYYYALTADHVVRKGRKREIRWADAETSITDVEVLATVPEADLAVLRFPTMKLKIPSLAIAPKSAKVFPFPVFSTGCDAGAKPTGKLDEVLARKLVRKPDETTAFYWQTKSPPSVGRSGGPLLDGKNQVIGICSGNQDGHGYYTHLDEIHALLKKHDLHWLFKMEQKP